MIDYATLDLFVAALSLRDFERFADCLAPSAQARMRLPRGFEVRTGRDEIARRFEGWFAPASDFVLLDTSRQAIGTRCRLTWRFRLTRGDRAPEVIEQVAFIDMSSEGIAGIDLLCSGFLDQKESQEVR